MDETDLAVLDRDALIALVRKLCAEVDNLRRAGKRQAAPFSKGTRVEDPKTPGRKPGQGTFERRRAPDPETLSEPPIEVPVAETACPKCDDGLLAHRLGPRLWAAAHHLHYGLGVPVRKRPEVIAMLTGVAVTQGAITRDALKQAAGAIGARCQNLCDSVRRSSMSTPTTPARARGADRPG